MSPYREGAPPEEIAETMPEPRRRWRWRRWWGVANLACGPLAVGAANDAWDALRAFRGVMTAAVLLLCVLSFVRFVTSHEWWNADDEESAS